MKTLSFLFAALGALFANPKKFASTKANATIRPFYSLKIVSHPMTINTKLTMATNVLVTCATGRLGQGICKALLKAETKTTPP